MEDDSHACRRPQYHHISPPPVPRGPHYSPHNCQPLYKYLAAFYCAKHTGKSSTRRGSVVATSTQLRVTIYRYTVASLAKCFDLFLLPTSSSSRPQASLCGLSFSGARNEDPETYPRSPKRPPKLLNLTTPSRRVASLSPPPPLLQHLPLSHGSSARSTTPELPEPCRGDYHFAVLPGKLPERRHRAVRIPLERVYATFHQTHEMVQSLELGRRRTHIGELFRAAIEH